MSDEKKKLPEDPAGTPGADPAGEQTPIEIKAAQKVAEALQKTAETWQHIEESGASVSKIIKKMQETNYSDILKAAAATFAKLAKDLEELGPYIEAELEKPEYGGKGLLEVLDYETPEGEELFKKIMDAAREARRRDISQTYKPKTSNFPVDRLNFMLPAIFEQAADGQLTFAETLNMNRSGKDDGAYLTFSVLFDGDDDEGEKRPKLSKRLEHFDGRIQGAISAGMDEGRTVFSTRTIWRAMGGKGDKPSKPQREKIEESMKKLARTTITIDNREEAEAYNYPLYKYAGSVLYWESLTEEKNGQTETYYRILRYPALVEFAKRRKQLTKIPIKVLQSPGNNTERKYQIEDYLLYRITRAKDELARLVQQQEKKYTKERAAEINKKKKLVIPFDTLLSKTGHAGARPYLQKRNVLEPAEALLKYYATEEAGKFISAIRKEGDTKSATEPTKFVITLK